MENLSKEIKEKGYKMTKARLAVLEIFSKNKEPLDAKNIYRQIKIHAKNRKINEVTVYRTLTSFEKAGIIKKVDLRKDSVHFERALEHHHHMVCTNCDTVEDFKSMEIEKLLGQIVEKSPHFKSKFKNITEHSLELFGLCMKCA